jgi:hypothetical protein
MSFLEHPDQVAAFRQRHPLAEEVFERLARRAHDLHSAHSKGLSDHQFLVMSMTHLALDDFFEVVLAAANSEGFAAQKLLRTMFERVVTLIYLTRNPDKMDDYIGYADIEQAKTVAALESSFGADALPQDLVARTKAAAAAVKGNYEGHKCKECGARGPALSWSGQLDLRAMAEQVGLRSLIAPGYVIPLGHAHPKPLTYKERIVADGHGGYTAVTRFSVPQSDLALSTAHVLALHLIQNSIAFFSMAADTEELDADFHALWGRYATTPQETQ